MNYIGDVFNFVLITPLTNLFVLLTNLTGNAGIAVILLTVIIRLITMPLTIKQMHSTRAMMALAPRQAELQKKFKDPRRRQQETMKLYREAGINPLGCFSSMLIQMPILISLYRVFIIAVGEAPESLIRLSERIYGWDYLRSGLPLPADFLWLHLGRPDPFVLPVLVAATTYTLQKMSTLPTTDEKQRAQAQMMNFMMPLFFGWITLTLPSGLGLYYALSNLIGMALQYAYVGGGPFNWRALVGLSQDAVLPRALEAREKATERFRKLGSDDEEDEPEAGAGAPAKPKRSRPSSESASSDSGSGARRRRRRYGRGRR
ncbi:MAG TPA: YidC/Oxa1 family membrane protein insertase [Dehalococcoidia bacterium]|nr:YidC/Oxa1 family membrane protein insertase [Dehalococcoidia bacterium]